LTDLEEPRIRCPSCGRSAPAMKYCIHCGARLPQAAPPTVRPTAPVPPPLPPTVPPPTRIPPSIPPTEVKDEIGSIVSGITVLIDRKVVLLNLFQSEQVSERVFGKLLNDYGGKLKDLLRSRNGKIADLRGRLGEEERRLSDVAMKLEELEVRRRVGEVDANVYAQETDRLKAEEREFTESVKTMKTNIERLARVFTERKPSEIRDLETKLPPYETAIANLAEKGKISVETLNAVRQDIKETLEFLNLLILDRKEKEKELRDQLETLQTRYKLSELSIEDYERRRRELQTEIDRIWG